MPAGDNYRLVVEAVGLTTSETSISFYETMRRYIPEECLSSSNKYLKHFVCLSIKPPITSVDDMARARSSEYKTGPETYSLRLGRARIQDAKRVGLVVSSSIFSPSHYHFLLYSTYEKVKFMQHALHKLSRICSYANYNCRRHIFNETVLL
jgi:hypothetical protein